MYRLLIADDEESIRVGLASFIRRECPDFEVVAQAVDGRQALQQARSLLPDVVITDITMPHMNGLEFLESLSEILPDAKFILISGYDQFDYAVHAIRLGVREYLLKPLDTDRLLAALSKLRRELDAQVEQWQQIQLLREDAREKEAREQWRYCRAALAGEDLPAPPPLFSVANGSWLCVLCRGDETCSGELQQMVQQQLSEKAQTGCVRLGSPPITSFVVVFDAKDASRIFVTLNYVFTSIAVYLRRTRDVGVHFYLSDVVNAPEKLAVCYQRSLRAMEYAFVESAGPVTSYKEVITDQLLPCKRLPVQITRDISAAVKAENKAAFYESSAQLAAWFEHEGVRDAGYMRMCALQLIFYLMEQEPQGLSMSYLEFTSVQSEIFAASAPDELRTCFENFVEMVWLRRKQTQPAPPILSEKVEQIVHLHLADMEFSLDDVAGELFISPNYLRQLFKQETGQTFVEYLTAQRMQHARVLLGNPEMKVNVAAEQCGYADARYFSVVFKKFFQQTPSEYQASLFEKG